MTKDEAITEIIKRAPLFLSERLPYKVNGVEQQLTYSDEHLFIVQIPAWVFRVLKLKE